MTEKDVEPPPPGDDDEHDGNGADPPAEPPELPEVGTNPDEVIEIVQMADVAAEYGPAAPGFLTDVGPRGFVVRLSSDWVDAVAFGELIQRLGRAHYWAKRRLFGLRAAPQFLGATQGGSVTVALTAPPDETPRGGQRGNETLFPTAYTGAYLARILAVNPRSAAEVVDPLGKRATQTYVSTLRDLAELEAATDWLFWTAEYEATRISATTERIRTVADAIDYPGGTTTRTLNIRGFLRAGDDVLRRVKLEVLEGDLKGRTITCAYKPELAEALAGSWLRTVTANVRATVPKNPDLPGAPRSRYEIIGVTRVFGRRSG